MKMSRRRFIGASAAGIVAIGAVRSLAEEKAGAGSATLVVAACGISCSACPLMKAGKCKGCGPANAMSAEMVSMKGCAVLTCASMKKIAFCGTDCKMYTKCSKLIGRPYAKEFMQTIETKLG